MSLSFRVEGLPPSYNKHFNINYNFRNVYLSPEARSFKTRLKFTMPYYDFKDRLLRIKIGYYYNWFFKNGNLRKFDTQNCDKILIDAIAEGLGIDDSYFKKRFSTDFYSPKDIFTFVEISILGLGKD